MTAELQADARGKGSAAVDVNGSAAINSHRKCTGCTCLSKCVCAVRMW